MKKKALTIAIVVVILLIAILGVCIRYFSQEETELMSIKSVKELENRYNYNYNTGSEIFKYIITMPFSLLSYSTIGVQDMMNEQMDATLGSESDATIKSEATSDIASSSTLESSGKDYSTTNIQVENVDEADIIKTDGDYIYSISENNVIITDVREPEKPQIASTITASEGIPEDMIISKNTLIVILSKQESTTYYSYYSSQSDTIVNIYNTENKEKPKLIKTYTMYEPYYTSRCINNKLYVISSGYLREDDNDKIITTYEENRQTKEIGLENIKYLKDIETRKQTLISFVDLNKIEEDVKINSYLIDISNAYVSENYIYLLNQKYKSSYSTPPISSIFGIKGILGITDYDNDYDYGSYTDIYKFAIQDNGEIEYKAKTNVKGTTINQYSLDEYEGNLRVALYNLSEGSRIVVFDEKLQEIGSTNYLAKGERMYSSRFIGDRAYLVTYKTIDPLFVVDLSNPKEPTVLGELKIPGYSTYLHPYDENYLIGIGMQTEEVINRNSSGKVTSTTAKVTGMKMALFDVSDVENPKEISNVVIGDSYTTSAILTNPKALLFSKEKGIIAIPVNRYSEEFEVNASDTYSSLVSSYTSKDTSRISEGYFVCNIDTENGFTVKGTITHDLAETTTYKYSYVSKLLRGLYIEDNLYTVSENEIKVNKLDTLEEISNLKIKGGTN